MNKERIKWFSTDAERCQNTHCVIFMRKAQIL